MRFDDPITDRQPKAGSVADIFCGEEWIEYLALVFWMDTVACIGNLDFDIVIILAMAGFQG